MKLITALSPVFLMLSILSPAAHAAAPTVEILNATWGGKDVTSLAQKHCDRANPCHYKVSERYLGKPAVAGVVDFELSWKCRDGEPREMQTVRSKREGETFEFACQPFIAKAEPKTVERLVQAGQRARNSIARLIQDPERGKQIRSEMNQSCVEYLSALYRSEQSLKSQCVTDLSDTLELFPFRSGLHDAVFFHYTDSEAPGRIVTDASKTESERHNELFTFLRERDGEHSLYVAEDPESTMIWGQNRLTVTLKAGARLIQREQAEKIGSCLSEIDNRHPGLMAACGTYVRPRTVLMLAILEDNGIALYDYFGAGEDHGRMWFHLVGPEGVEKIEFSRR